MLTGDRSAVAESIGSLLHLDRIYAEQSPEDKLAVVKAIRETPGLGPVVMVGDGINDAPALALADVGIAMGSVGATASSETADAIVLVDRIDRVVDAIQIGRRSLGSHGRASSPASASRLRRWCLRRSASSRRWEARCYKRASTWP